MIKSLYTAATGMKGQQTYVDAISNNLANVNTTGFKRSQPTFQDLLYVTMKAPGIDQTGGNTNPVGIQVGSGVKVAGTTMNFTNGVLEGTSRNLDVAITGPGFFQVLLPDGAKAYTRDGHFQIDASGRLTNSSGYVLQPQIAIPEDTISLGIAEDGQVTVTQASSPDISTPIAQLELTRFVNPSGLNQIGGNLYLRTDAAGTEIRDKPGSQGMGQLQQNFLERSNVEVVSELVNLIVAQRAYEVNSRTIRSSDQMLQQVSSIVR
ncbi:MAG: flagellar basal-body rod protein FlgG [Planctomycetota bacterium]|nr:MAG: flagellar basal-body rod protein FlgG [Planctomycetota bacterium]